VFSFDVSTACSHTSIPITVLVDKEGMELGEQVRDKLVNTRQAVLDITRSTDVGGAHAALMRASSQVRHPYVDPINCVQAELLRRIRAFDARSDLSKEEEEEKELLKDALIVSITGIAQGLRNSG
jgi:phosphoenolpyruvate carboxylase